MVAWQIQESGMSVILPARTISSVRKAVVSRKEQTAAKNERYSNPGTIWNLLSKLRIAGSRNIRANSLCRMNLFARSSPRY